MKNLKYIARMELRIYFTSPIVYILATVFFGICGYIFWDLFVSFSENSFKAVNLDPMLMNEHISAHALVFIPLFSYMGFFLLLIVPLMTMRLFSEEKKIGTIELLVTYPTTPVEIVCGKLLASSTVLAIMLGVTWVYPLITGMFGILHFGPLFAGYMGLLLQGFTIMSIGVFCSSLTENQIVSAIITYGIVVMMSSIQWTADFIPQLMRQVLHYLSMSTHLSSFTSGVIDTRDIIYFILMSLFFLWLTLKSLESERWRA